MSWQIINQSLPIFAKAFQLTIWLSAVGIILSIVVGIFCSLIQYFKVPILSQLITAYVELARNTPLLIQLFFLYYAFPVIGLKMSAQTCGIIGLVFLGGAYMAEGFTGGFAGVSATQIDDGKALGMNNLQLARYVVFPQGFALS
ncbi:MAG: ABC transporter permease subunit, partial [Lactobacillus sp.]|nr:ABC transporter permease subunit [Lactobacillus sp.]